MFTLMSSLTAHMCEKKRRFFARRDRDVMLGLQAYQHWTKVNQRPKKPPGIEEMERTQFYTAFVRFGRYMLDMNAISPIGYLDFLIRVGVRIDDWCSDRHYGTYLREMVKTETPDAALQRNILLMEQWAVTANAEWTDFFRKVAPGQAVKWIRSGRISPWVLFTARSAMDDLFGRMTDEQKNIVAECIDPVFWQRKLEMNKKDVEQLTAILDEAGV